MIPQVEVVLCIKKLLDYFQLKQIGGLKTEVILRLARFVGKITFRTTSSFRTPVADVRYDLRPRENRKYLDWSSE